MPHLYICVDPWMDWAADKGRVVLCPATFFFGGGEGRN